MNLLTHASAVFSLDNGEFNDEKMGGGANLILERKKLILYGKILSRSFYEKIPGQDGVIFISRITLIFHFKD